VNGHLWELAIPLRSAFSTAAGRVTVRRVVLVRIGDGETRGWGEAAPYPGVTPDTVDDARGSLERGTVLSPTAAAALDEATNDLAARRSGVPLRQRIGGSHRPLPTSVAVGLDADPVERLTTTGAAAVKLKIRPGSDLERVVAVREAYPDVVIGVDANGSYTWEGRDPLLELDRLGVDYVEQPFPADDLDAHARLRDEIVAPVALDEPIDSETAAIRVIERGAADLIVVKPSRLGVTASRTIHDLALAAGLRIKASGLIETAVGRAHTHAVASLPAAVFSDVARPGWFLAGAVEADAAVGPADVVSLPLLPGSGVDPDPEVFAPYVVGEAPLGSRIWD